MVIEFLVGMRLQESSVSTAVLFEIELGRPALPFFSLPQGFPPPSKHCARHWFKVFSLDAVLGRDSNPSPTNNKYLTWMEALTMAPDLSKSTLKI